MKYPWTRLQGSDLWVAAEAHYRSNGLEYHNIDHVGALYGHADRLDLPYDERLDQNILAHDVILHLGPGINEDRSRDWLLDITGRGRGSSWADPILATKEHRPSEDTTGLAMLDLADFTDVHAARRNTELLRREAATPAGSRFDVKAWLSGTMQYLDGLRGRIREDIPGMRDHPHLETWTGILRGIEITMECAPARYDPHPAANIQRYTRDMESLLLSLPEGDAEPVSVLSDRIGDPERAMRTIGGLVWHGLAEYDRGSADDRRLRLTGEGADWTKAMTTPDQDYPMP